MKFNKETTEVKDLQGAGYTYGRGSEVDSNLHKLFSEKRWVWVPHKTKAFVAGCVISEKNGIIEVECDNSVSNFRSSEVFKMNPPKFDMVEDLAALSHLNEPSVLNNLKKRYEADSIYTYSGLFLLAINPYRNLKIYDDKHVKKYAIRKKYDHEPHIFAVANEAYNLMISNRENQSILITGESGAGKTENTKKVIQFLASVAGYKSEFGTIDRQIIESNPILEAFGNAKTIKNDNSSRFGKFIQIKFNGGNICGASIEKYLLEKSRVTKQNRNERNYHIFYQLIRGADASLRNELLLTDNIEYFRYLKDSAYDIPGVDDVQEFRKLRESMRALNVPIEREKSFYRIVSAILHLGNLQFKKIKDQTEIVNMDVAEKVCRLLKISSADFIKYLLHPIIKAGREIVTQNRTVEQAYRIVDALSKLLYDKMFDAVIDDLNKSLGAYNYNSFIGVLDIAGFEIFKENSFEQLCINYTNEKLQQFFNHHMFILEQEIYKQENIDWNFIDFGLDLQPTIDLIEKNNPIGILSFLDEECVMPGASDKTFLDKLLTNIKNEKFEGVKFKSSFRLTHYAGSVEYNVNDWLTKNKDPNSDCLNGLINRSQDIDISKLSFLESENVKKGYFRTTSQMHKEQLISLMRSLSSTNPHFVRCIIPNLQKTGEFLDSHLILDQLKCNGVLEGIRISRQGFPSRMKYKEFVDRYKIFLADLKKIRDLNFASQSFYHLNNSDLINYKEISELILNTIKVNSSQYRFGKTKIFFRQSILADIEDLRDIRIAYVMREIQAITRMKMTQRQYNIDEQRKKAMILIQKNAKMCIELQKWPWWRLYLKVKPLLEVNKRENDIKEKESKISEFSKKFEEQSKNINDLAERLKEITGQREQLLKKLESEKAFSAEKDETLMMLREKNAIIAKELDSKNQEYLSLQKYLEDTFKSMKAKSLKYEKNAAKLGLEKDKLEKKISELEDTLMEKEKQIEETKTKMLNTQAENRSHLEGLIKASENEIVVLKSKLKQKDAVLNSLEKDHKKTREDLEDLRRNISSLEEEYGKVSDQNKLLNDKIELSAKQHQNEIEQANSTIKKLQDENVDLCIENEKLESEKMKIQRLCDEKDSQSNRVLKEMEYKDVTIENLKKTVSSLKQQLVDYENTHEEERQNQMYLNTSHESLMEKIKNYERKNKGLADKCAYLESINAQISQEKDELHKENLQLLQAKLDDIFNRESGFNMTKKALQKEIQQLESENKHLKRENEELKMRSESSDDSISTSEKLYNMLEQEKKNKKLIEQQIIQYENSNMVLKNEVEELKDKCDILQKEKEELCRDLEYIKSCKNESNEFVKNFDAIYNEINTAIDGFNNLYFKILDNNKKEIDSLVQSNIEKQNIINEMDSKITRINDEILEVKTQFEESRNENIKLEKNMNIIINEYDSLKVKYLSLEQLVGEKDKEIVEYKKSLQNYQNMLDEIQARHSGEILSLKKNEEEINSKFVQLKNEYDNYLSSFLAGEHKEKKMYEDKISTIFELEQKKRNILETENSRLLKENQDIEKRLFDLHNSLIDTNLKLENMRFENGLLLEKEKQYVHEIERLKRTVLSLEEKTKALETASMVDKNTPVVYVVDKERLQALERKRIILEKEFNKNQDTMRRHNDERTRLVNEKEELKKEISDLKTQLFDLEKNNNAQCIMLNQLRRELNDDKDLLSFLKSFSISKKAKK